MKRFLSLLGLLLALAVGGLLLAPGFMDIDRLRPVLSEALATTTGRQVTLGGSASLSLLPHPTLTVADIALYLPEQQVPADEPVVRAERAVFRIAPLPLLLGEVRVTRLHLEKPRLSVARAADGRWTLPFAPAALGGTARIDGLTVADGQVVLSAQGRTLVLESVSGSLGSGDAQGPFNLAATFTAAGLPGAVDITAGRLPQGEAVPVRALLTLGNPDTGLRFAGVAGSGELPLLNGELRAFGTRLEDFLRLPLGRSADGQHPPLAPVFERPFDLRGTLTLEAKALSLDGIEMEIGQDRLEGSFELAAAPEGGPPRGGLVLTTGQLTLDHWLPEGGAGLALPDLSAEGMPVLALDLLADRATWRDGTLRDLRMLGTVRTGGLDIEAANAVLPGDATLALAGTVEQAGPFALDLELSTDRARDLLAWGGVQPVAVPAERLGRAALNGRLQRDAGGGIGFAGVADLDTSRFEGRVATGGSTGPDLTLLGRIDRLNLDAYWPDAVSALPEVLQRASVAVDLELDELTAFGLPSSQVVLSGRSGGGIATIAKASAGSVAGLELESLSGTVGFGAQAGQTDLSVRAAATTLAPLFRALAMEPPLPPERVGAVAVTGRLSGAAAARKISAQIGMLGGDLTLAGTIDASAEAPALGLTLRAILPDGGDLLRLVWPDWRPAEALPLDVYAAIGGTTQRLDVSAIDGIVAGTTVKGTLLLDRTAAKPDVRADLALGPIGAEALLAAFGGPDSALGWLQQAQGRVLLKTPALAVGDTNLEEADLDLVLAGTELRLERLAGRWRGGAVAAGGRLVREEGGSITASLSASVEAATLGPEVLPLEGSVSGRVALAGTGPGIGAAVASLAGDGNLSVSDGRVLGLDLTALNAGLKALKSADGLAPLLTRTVGKGGTTANRLEVRFHRQGDLTRIDGLVVEAAGGQAQGTGTLEPGDAGLALSLEVDPGGDGGAPAFPIRVTGPPAAPRWQVDPAPLARWIAQTRPVPASAPQPAPQPASPAPAAPPRTPAKPPAPPKQPAAPQQEQAPATDAVRGILDRLRGGGG